MDKYNKRWINGLYLPIVAGGMVYLMANGNLDSTVYAWDAATGAAKWTYDPLYFINAAPAVAGEVVYVGADNNTFYALDSVTGTVKWKIYRRR